MSGHLGSILVVDDDDLLGELIVEWLEAAGWQVAWASTAAEALGTLRQTSFDGIVTDALILEAGEGEAVIAWIQAHPHTPVIAVSGGFVGGLGLDVARAVNARQCLAKPFARAALLDAVASHFKKGQGSRG
ncbi:MAG: response regulator [Candidatus Competibacterales bacterium]